MSSCSSVKGNTASGSGGAIYMLKGSAKLGSDKDYTDNTVTGDTTARGGAIYLHEGSISGSSIDFSGSRAAGGKGGVLYVNSGTVTLTDSTFSQADATGDTKSATATQGGGAVYMASGTVDLSGATITNSSATSGNGGAVYIGSGTLNLNGANLSNSSANKGGGLYMDGGSVSMLKTGSGTDTKTPSLTGSKVSGEDAQGAAVYMNGGSLELDASASAANGNTGSYVFYIENGTSSLKHKSGAVTGSVYANGSYEITLPEVSVSGIIKLNNSDNPLKISEASTGAGTNTFTVDAQSTIFATRVIVDGFVKVPATIKSGNKGQFTIKGTTDISEQSFDIVAGQPTDIFWDPGKQHNATNDTNTGTADKPVHSFERAKTLLANAGRKGRIVMVSQFNDSTSYTNISRSFDGQITTATDSWEARIVRGYNKSKTSNNYLTGDMFTASSKSLSFSNIVISGEFVSGGAGTPTASGSLVNGVITSANNAEFCNNVSSVAAVRTGSSTPTFTNCKFTGNSNSGTDGGALYIGAKKVTLNGCTFASNNSAKNGGAIAGAAGFNLVCGVDTATGKKTQFISNSTDGAGGAIYSNSGGGYDGVNGDSISLTSVVFNGNTATKEGGAIKGSDLGVTATACEFTYNESKSDGGAIYVSIYAGSSLEIKGGCFIGNKANGSGGAIYHSLYADLEILADNNGKGTEFSGNSAISGDGGAIYTSYGCTINKGSFGGNSAGTDGGAVCSSNYVNVDVTGTGTSSFSDNSAGGDGGAIWAGDVSIKNGSFENNSATGDGGAICHPTGYYGEAAYEACSFSGNSAKNGGAVYMPSNVSEVYISDSSYENNKAVNGHGGAIYYNASNAEGDNYICSTSFDGNSVTGGFGGAIYAAPNVWLRLDTCSHTDANHKCSFSNNSAIDGAGGAIFANKANVSFGKAISFSGNSTSGYANYGTGGGYSEDDVLSGGGALYFYESYVSDGYGVETAVPAHVFSGNSGSSGAAIYWDSNKYDFDINGASFTGNYGVDEGGLALEVLYVEGNNIDARIQNCTFGNLDATEYPATMADAIASGGNAAEDIVSLCIIGGKATVSGVVIKGNYGNGLRLYSESKSASISSSNFDCNSGDGAKLDGFTADATASVSSSTFNKNGGNGLEANCGNLFQQANDGTIGRMLQLSQLTIDGNGDSGLMLSGSDDHNGATNLSSVTISNNGGYELGTITNESGVETEGYTGTQYGGGIYVGDNVTLFLDSSSKITGNKAVKGGAIYWEQNSAFAQEGNGAVLSENEAVYGGAFYVTQPVTISGFVVKNNTAKQGGGMFVDMANITAAVTVQNDDSIDSSFTGNKAEQGGAIYVSALADETAAKARYLDLRSVEISGNESTSDSGYSSGIYNAGSRLYLNGDNANIQDNIYLNQANRHVHLSSGLSDVMYSIAVRMQQIENDGGYQYGDVVMSPIVGGSTNAANYLRNTRAVVPGSVFAKGKCGTEHTADGHTTADVDAIVLRNCIFVNSENSLPENQQDGTTPLKAFETMQRAIDAAAGTGVIYVCANPDGSGGYILKDNENWTAGSGVEIRRYTGFNIGGDANTQGQYGQDFICHGDLITVPAGKTLTLGNGISTVSGSHNASDTINASGSVFDVSGTLNLNGALVIDGNTSTSADGSAIMVHEGGTVNVAAAVSVSASSGVNGGGIYNAGTVNVNSGSLSISGCSASGNGASVYNNGTFRVDDSASFSADAEFYIAKGKHLTVESSSTAINSGMEPLFIDIEAPADQRVYVSYENAFNNETQEEAKYALSPSVTASYLRSAGTGNKSLILSQSNVVYVGNKNASGVADGVTLGMSADKPFKSMQEAYSYLFSGGRNGGLIYIVEPVTISDSVTLGSNYYNNGAKFEGGVSIRRYSKPTDFTNTDTQSFNAPSNTGALFIVGDGASLTIDGVSVDGHNYVNDAAGEKTQFTIADAVKATAALVEISGSGTLSLKGSASLVSNTNTSMKGDAVRHEGGSFTIDGAAELDGSVYLGEGEFVTVNDATTSPASAMNLLLDDDKDGRVIAKYTQGADTQPAAGETGKYVLPQNVADNYRLVVDAAADTVILRYNRAVYVHGTDGNDANEGTPDAPILTLRRAYELLSGHGGTIYIVGTVNIEAGANITLNNTSYYDGNTVTIQSGQVDIARYSRPTNYKQLSGYNRESFTGGALGGALFNVDAGASLSLGQITVDGHNQARSGAITVAAPAINGGGPLITVRGDMLLDGAELINNTNNAGRGGALSITSSGSVLMRGGAKLSGNRDSVGHNGVFLNGKLEIGGQVDFAANQWIYENRIGTSYGSVEVSGNFTKEIPVELPDMSVETHYVIARYVEGLKPNENMFSLTEANTNKAAALNFVKTTEGQNVTFLATYDVVYSLSNLTATGSLLAPAEAEYQGSIKANAGYALPQSITRITVFERSFVKDDSGNYVGQYATTGTELKAVDDYVYDPATGSIRVYGEKVTGKLLIEAAGVPVRSITFSYVDAEDEPLPDGAVVPADKLPTSTLDGNGFAASFYPGTGYDNLSLKSVKVGGTEIAAENYSGVYDSNNKQLDITVNDGAHINGSIDVIIAAQLKQYNIGEQIDGVTMDLPDKIGHGEALSGTQLELENSDKYSLPETVRVYVGSRELKASEFNYNNDTGMLSIIAGVIDGDVRITGVTVIKTFDLKFNLSPANALEVFAGTGTKVAYDAKLSTGISVKDSEKYALPLSITVSVNGETYTVESGETANGISYYAEAATDPVSGETIPAGTVSIAKNIIHSDVTITAAARPIYEVKYVGVDNTNGPVKHNGSNPMTVISGDALEAKFTVDEGYEITGITVTQGNGTENIGTRDGNSVTVDAGVITTGPVTITVAHGLKQYNISESITNADVKHGTSIVPDKTDDDSSNDSEYKVEHGKDIVLTIVPDDENGYTYPDSVTVNGTVYDGDETGGITYNKTNGTITIPGDLVNGEITITGLAKLKTYTVKYTANANIVQLPGETSVIHGGAYTGANFKAAEGYYIQSVTDFAVGEYKPDTATYNGDVVSGHVEIASVTSNVTITVNTAKRSYSVTENNDKYSVAVTDGGTTGNKVAHGGKPTIVINPIDGYDAPLADNLTVTILDPDTGTEQTTLSAAAGDFIYVRNADGTGTITITDQGAAKIKGPVVIGGTAVAESYVVTYDLGGLLKDNDSSKLATYGQSYTTSISKNSDKGTITMPTAATVKVASGAKAGNHTVSIDANGNITVPADIITGPFEIYARASQSFNVSVVYDENELTVATGEASINGNSAELSNAHAANDFTTTIGVVENVMYVVPTASEITVVYDDTNKTPVTGYNYTTGTTIDGRKTASITIDKELITDDIIINLSAVKLHTVTTTADNNGSIETVATKYVIDGENLEYTVKAASGWAIVNAKVSANVTSAAIDKGDETNNGDYTSGEITLTKVTGDVTVTVNTVRRQYTVTNSASNTYISGTEDNPDNEISMVYGSKDDIVITPNTGFDPPKSVTITLTDENGEPLKDTEGNEIGNITLTAGGEGQHGYSYVVEDGVGKIKVPTDEGITGKITITGDAVPEEYNITADIVNSKVYDVTKSAETDERVEIPDTVPAQNAHTVTFNETILIQVEPDDENGYTYPASVTVNINGSDETVTVVSTDPATVSSITYNKTTGKLTIPGSFVDGVVVIGGQSELKDYSISESFDHATVTLNNTAIGANSTVKHGDKPVLYIQPDASQGYTYPSSVSITMGGNSFTGFSYDQTTGEVTFTAPVTGLVVIGGVEELITYNVKYIASPTGSVKTETIEAGTVKHGQTYTKSGIEAETGWAISQSNPASITVAGTYGTASFANGTETANQDYTSGTVTVTNVTSDISITVNAVKRVYEVSGELKEDGESKADVQVGNTEGDKEYEHGENPTINILPNPGYNAPNEITVIVKNPDTGKPEEVTLKDGEEEKGFKYVVNDDGTGTVTVPEGTVGDISISGTPVRETLDISFVFTEAESKGTVKVGTKDVTDGDKVSFKTGYTATIDLEDGWKLDATTPITVKVTPTAGYTPPDDKTYTASEIGTFVTGATTGDKLGFNLSIPAAYVTGAVEVTIKAEKRSYTMFEDVDDATVTKDNVNVVEKPDEGTTVTGTPITDGEELKLEIKPDTDHTLPDEITVIVTDPETGVKTLEVTVEKGETDTTSGVSYGEDGTVTIPADKVTGPVEISGKALEKFDVSYAVEVAKDENGQPEYTRGESVKDITVTPKANPNLDAAIESHEHELTVKAEPGYSITKIVVTNGSETGIVFVTETGTNTSGYSYGNDDKLKIGEVKGNVEVTIHTQLTRYNVNYELGGEAGNIADDTFDVVSGFKNDETDKNFPVYTRDFVTKLAPKSTITLPDKLYVKIGDAEQVEVQKSATASTTEISYTEELNGNAVITIPGSMVNGDVFISADGIRTFDVKLSSEAYPFELTASDVPNDSGKTKLIQLPTDTVTADRLKGKTFKVETVTLTDKDNNDKGEFTLKPHDDFTDSFVKSSGSKTANTVFGLTAEINGQTVDIEKDKVISFADDYSDDTTDLTLQLYNANALTDMDEAGVVYVLLKSYDSETDNVIGDTIEMYISIKRVPSQINVTVPLVLVMKTNIDGGTVTDMGSYAIDNNSSMRVQLSKAAVEDNTDANSFGLLMEHDTSSTAINALVDKYRVTFKQNFESKPEDLSADGTKVDGKPADVYNPIASIATSPLSFVTRDKDENGNDCGVHMATVNYTIRIPEE